MATKAKRKGLLRTLLILAFLIIFLYWDNNALQVSRYVLEYGKLPEAFNGYRIVQISDMHGKTFGKGNISLAGKIRGLKPDLLICTGDMMSSTVNDGGAFIDFLDSFKGACPVYMCLGNHEQIARWFNNNGDSRVDYYKFIDEVQKRGVILLDNEKAYIERDGERITIFGLTLELYHYSRRDLDPNDVSMYLTQSYIEDVIGKPEKGFNLLMAHNPAYFKEYTSWGADLTLSGHVHGGIIQVPFKGGLLSPERVFFPEYDAGLFENNSLRMNVNRGLGYSQINFRLFNRPEITLIELKKK